MKHKFIPPYFQNIEIANQPDLKEKLYLYETWIHCSSKIKNQFSTRPTVQLYNYNSLELYPLIIFTQLYFQNIKETTKQPTLKEKSYSYIIMNLLYF